MIYEEEVKLLRYKNSDQTPKVGDVVWVCGHKVVVGQLGGVRRMFCNCTFDGVFVLTDPRLVSLVDENT